MKKKSNHARRRGLASQFKRWFKRTVRKTAVRRWLFVLVVKTVGWLAKRLWCNEHHINLSP